MTTFDELRWKKFPVGSDGFICLVDKMGDDAAIVQAARVSYGKDARECPACKGAKGFVEDTGAPREDGSFIETWATCPECNGTGTETKDDRNLIRYLMRHRHSTPFEMAELKLLVRIPMDAWRQWIRHRTANVNEYSTRYAEAIDSCAVTAPDEWRLQSGSNKQGSGGQLPAEPSGWLCTQCGERRDQTGIPNAGGACYGPERGENYYGHNWVMVTCGSSLSVEEERFQAEARRVYEKRIAAGVAREQARKDLPLSTYTEAYWKCDLHNILHFLGLRMDSHAQKEIRDYATILGEEIVKPLFPTVWEAFVDYRLGSMTLSRLEINAIQLMHYDGLTFDQVCKELPEWDAIAWKGDQNMFVNNGWDKDKCRERDECKAKLERMGLL